MEKLHKKMDKAYRATDDLVAWCETFTDHMDRPDIGSWDFVAFMVVEIEKAAKKALRKADKVSKHKAKLRKQRESGG